MEEFHIDSALMRYEWYRLQSFSKVKGKESVSFLRLANEGFYYIGYIDLAKCYFCGYEWHNWSDGNIPGHCDEQNINIPIHPDRTHSLLVPSGVSLSPPTTTHFHHIKRPDTCLERSASVIDFYRKHHSERLATGGNGNNEDSSSCQSLRKEFESDKSRQKKPQNDEHTDSIPDIAVEIEGSVDTESTQSTENAGETCKTSTKSDRPTRTSTTPIGPQCKTRNSHTTVNHTVVQHEDSSERCRKNSEPFRNSDKGALYPSNIIRHPSANSLPNLGKRVKTCPGVPQIYKDRLATFQGVSLPQPADLLAANGFYYIGDSDVVKCAYCGGVWNLKDSRHTSDTVHEPDCKAILTQKTSESRETSSQPNSLSDIAVSSLPAVQEVKTFGFQTPDIVNAYRETSGNIGE